MLKKFLAAGAVVAGFAGMGLSAPALAESGNPWPSVHNEYNIASQSDNVAVCGNSVIDNIVVGLIPVGPLTTNSKDAADCSVKATQN